MAVGARLSSFGSKIYASVLKPMMLDYRNAIKDTFSDAKSVPLKSAIYLSLFGTGVYGFFTNPKEASYIASVVEASNLMLLLGQKVQNKTSNEYIQNQMNATAKCTNRYQSYGIFSVIYDDKYDANNKYYQATCKYLTRPWYQPYKDVRDVGVFNTWWRLKYTMTDYDINFEDPTSEDNYIQTYKNMFKKLLGYSAFGNPMVPLKDQIAPIVIFPSEEDIKKSQETL